MTEALDRLLTAIGRKFNKDNEKEIKKMVIMLITQTVGKITVIKINYMIDKDTVIMTVMMKAKM